MPLFAKNDQATDPMYNNIQEPLFWQDPPTLSRTHVEELYELTKPYLDKNFHVEIMHAFRARYSEMYFAATFIEKFSEVLGVEADAGADFYLSKLGGWAEVVTPTDGDPANENSVPKTIYGEVANRPSREIILRFAQSFVTKSLKFKSDIETGVVGLKSPLVMCIQGGALSESLVLYAKGGYPEIVKTLLPIGDLVVDFNVRTKEVSSCRYKYRDSIPKSTKLNKTDIDVGFFLKAEHSHISAVIFSSARPDDPMSRENWGSDFHTIHNPLADHPLEPNYITCGREYKVTLLEHEIKIETIKH